MNAAMTTQSAPELQAAFTILGQLDPPGFPQWTALAQQGREAALRGDFPAVKRVCTTCHDQYRARYRRELRGRPLPPAAAEPAARAL